MSTIAEFRIPAADTTMGRTFEAVPALTIELESSVSNSLPSLWASGVERATLEGAFRADPTVDDFVMIAETDDRILYDVDSPAAQRLYDHLLAADGSLLEGSGTDGWWQFKMRFRSRDHLVETHECLADREMTVDLVRVTDISSALGSGTRLTPEQHEALVAALERGYFQIPRQITMEELATELDISHQALSERLRRAYGTLVDAELQPVNEPSR